MFWIVFACREMNLKLRCNSMIDDDSPYIHWESKLDYFLV